MVDTPPQTDTYSTALDIFDRTHPLRVDADENLKVTGTFTTTPSGTQDVRVVADTDGLAKDSTVAALTKPSDIQLVAGSVVVSNLPASQPVAELNVDKNFGSWAYYGGVAGTIVVAAGQRVLSISCHSTIGGTLQINGGQTIPIPANVGFAINPLGNLTAPTIVYTNTDSYFIEVVS